MKFPHIFTAFYLLGMLLTPKASASLYYSVDDIQQKLIAEANKQNISPSLALAIAKVESNFNPTALSHAGAKGVMQIMPRTAEQAFGVHRNQLFDPDVNIELGVKYIKKLLERYDNRLDIALSHYNGGSKVNNRHGGLSVIPATQAYVDKVLTSQQDFIQHDKRDLLAAQLSQSGISYIDNTGEHSHGSQLTVPPFANPQIETLRALRLHNTTRNYKDKRERYSSPPSTRLEKSPSSKTSINEKMAKVRQWESIYTTQ